MYLLPAPPCLVSPGWWRARRRWWWRCVKCWSIFPPWGPRPSRGAAPCTRSGTGRGKMLPVEKNPGLKASCQRSGLDVSNFSWPVPMSSQVPQWRWRLWRQYRGFPTQRVPAPPYSASQWRAREGRPAGWRSEKEPRTPQTKQLRGRRCSTQRRKHVICHSWS